MSVTAAQTVTALRDIGLFLFYGWLFWRTFKNSKGNRVIQCGTIAVMLFFVILALLRIPNVPFDYVWWLFPAVFSLCMLTMFFLFQQGYRALRNRWGRKQFPKS
jgi:hypothetical protein